MYFLSDRKYQRTRHTGKIFTSALCSRRILRALGRALARHFRLPLVFRVLRNLICTAIQEKLYPRKSSNSPRTMAWKQAALRWIFQRCPLDKLLMLAAKTQTSLAFARLHVTFRRWRGICLAMEYSANFTRTMVISKRNRHHQNHSKQPGKHRKQDKICLSGAYMRCCYCVKSELFCPRCLNEQLFAANNSRPRDVALRLLSIRLLWLILPVPGLFVLLAVKRT